MKKHKEFLLQGDPDGLHVRFPERKKMKKLILSLFLVAVPVLAVIPVVTGMIMENQVKKTVEDFTAGNANSGSDLTLTILAYDRGLYFSDIEWEIRSKILQNLYGIAPLILTDRADHGFLSCRTRTSLGKNQWYADLVKDAPDGKDPLRMTTEFHFSGRMTTFLELDPLTFRHRTGMVTVRPAQAVISVEPGGERIHTDLTLEGVDAPGDFHLEGLSSRYEKTFDTENNRFSIGFQGRLNNLGSKETKIQQTEGRLDIRNMTAAGFAALTRLPGELAGKADRPDRLAGDSAFWFRMGEALLKQGLEIRLTDLRSITPQGRMNADMTLRLEKDLNPAEILSFLFQPATLLSFFSLDARASLPRGTLNDEDLLTSPLYPGLPCGWFVLEGDRLVHDSRIRDGRLFLNHNEVRFN